MAVNLVQSMTQHPAYDGELANVIELSNSCGMRVTFMDIGATWLSCKLCVNDEEREVLLGVSNMADFESHKTYLGATVGRFANRIAGGRFTIGQERYQTLINQGDNVLHGGPEGFNKRRWNVDQLSDASVCFSLLSPNNDQGFPGNVAVAVTYTLTESNEVIIRYTAKTDRATPVNLTNHAYFNLENAEQGSDCRNHSLTIAADYYLPTNEQGIPLGRFVSVDETSFDFRNEKTVGCDFLSDEQQLAAKGYDHCYIFNPIRAVKEPVAELKNSDRSIKMSVYTDKPAMQFYTGNWNAGTPRRISGEYCDYSAIALETQLLPDSPNHPEWPTPSSILQPGELYQYQTSYKFEF